MSEHILSPELLLSAYCQGIFPMAEPNGTLYWYDPDPRTIMPLDSFHVPRRLARTVRNGPYQVRFNSDFLATIKACAAPARGREETWISDEIIEVYYELHKLGFAHSVETWLDGEMVGGLYGVAIHGLFAGESMFSRARDASKVALVRLVEHLRAQGFVLLDTQFSTEHLAQFGILEVSRSTYKQLLLDALRKTDVHF
jgi:leucyl/phenylalanyl-tRNA--protein transferase